MEKRDCQNFGAFPWNKQNAFVEGHCLCNKYVTYRPLYVSLGNESKIRTVWVRMISNVLSTYTKYYSSPPNFDFLGTGCLMDEFLNRGNCKARHSVTSCLLGQHQVSASTVLATRVNLEQKQWQVGFGGTVDDNGLCGWMRVVWLKDHLGKIG